MNSFIKIVYFIRLDIYATFQHEIIYYIIYFIQKINPQSGEVKITTFYKLLLLWTFLYCFQIGTIYLSPPPRSLGQKLELNKGEIF